MQKLDHGTIFLMIAGSYTPVCLMVLQGWVTLDDARHRLDRRARWASCSRSPAARRAAIVRSTLYIGLGWAAVAAVPQMWTHMSIAELVLIAVGGVLFTVGAVFLLHPLARPVPAGVRVPRGVARAWSWPPSPATSSPSPRSCG